MAVSPDALSLGIRATLVVCILLPGLLTALMPWLTPAGEVFAVTVPTGAARDPRLVALRRRYTAGMLALAFVVSAVALANPGNVALFVALSLLLPVLGFFGMLACRSRVIALKRSEGWRVKGSRAVSVALPAEAPAAIPLRWNLLYVPVILVTVAITWMLYPSMPDRIVMQVGFDGQVTSWADKSLRSVAFPVFTQVFMAVVLTACHVAVVKSKRPGSADAPVASALRYGGFAQAQTIVLLGTGLVFCADMALIPFADAGLVDLGGVALFTMATTLLVLVVSAVIAVCYGQTGSRLLADAAGTSAQDVPGSDDDARWKAGVFYVDADDPSVFVPKRFGIGWTVNYGNWRSWLVLAALVLATVLFVVAVSMI